MAKTGGHLGSSLGVVELTVALHFVFNTPVSIESIAPISIFFCPLIQPEILHYPAEMHSLKFFINVDLHCEIQEDKIVWDVGHQAYIHKMLTGRRKRMHTIRQQGGLSGELVITISYTYFFDLT